MNFRTFKKKLLRALESAGLLLVPYSDDVK